MRIGMPARLAASTTCSTLSGPPMFPGLIRTAATPASIALSARLALKWMSAITGSGDRRTMRARATASSVFGTAQRTSSQPAEASAAIWRDRRLHVAGRRQRHRLDDDRRAAADRDAADVDLDVAGHYEPRLPMSFDRPTKKSRSTTARPIAETRS